MQRWFCRRSIARDGGGGLATDLGRCTYPFLRSRPLRVPPLRRVTFGKRPKSNQKVLPLRTAFAALRFPRSGVHQGASTPVGFASTSIRCPRLRRGALRAIPLMNTSARPPDGAGRSRSKAKARRDLPVGANPVAAAEPARLRSTPKGAQDLETAGGPSVLSQPRKLGSGYRGGVSGDCCVVFVRFFSLICRAFPRESPGYISVVLASCVC